MGCVLSKDGHYESFQSNDTNMINVTKNTECFQKDFPNQDVNGKEVDNESIINTEYSQKDFPNQDVDKKKVDSDSIENKEYSRKDFTNQDVNEKKVDSDSIKNDDCSLRNIENQNNDIKEVENSVQASKGSQEKKLEHVEPSQSSLDIIDASWIEIDSSISKMSLLDSNQINVENETKSGWKVIRLFISSTFADFHEEREVLIKKVVPELREWCEQRQVHLIECDLRWGVPKNTDSKDTISTCLDEVSRCIKETNGHPFFLNMLSERYGWIPKKEDLSDELISAYNWVFPLSITHMEILCAALRTNSRNSLFMIRDEESLAGIPDSFSFSFIDTQELSKLSLQRLKKELKKRFPNKTYSYKSKIVGVDTSTGLQKLRFNELDEFASVITKYYKERIEEFAPLVKEIVDNSAFQQNAFIQKKGSLLVGREKEISNIMEFATTGEKKCFLLIAEQGSGKSSLIAASVLQLSQKQIPCLYNFSSSTPGSTESLQVMLHFIQQLSAQLNKPSPENMTGYENILNVFHNLLKEICVEKKGFTIVLDAVNQFEDEAGQSCSWLPLPSDDLDIRYLISCTPDFGNGYSSINEKFQNQSEIMYLQGFTTEHRIKLVQLLFGRYNKKLDPEQLDLLVSSEGSSSPLWLALACEELRVFGVFERVTERIKELPSTIDSLISFILKRIITEDDTNKIEKTLCYLACSAHNLAEMELLHLLGDENGETLPMFQWVKIRRQIKPFLLNTGSENCEFYSFFHSSAKQVVFQTFLQEENKVKEHHKELGTYFLKHGANDYRTASAIVFHFKKSGMAEEIISFLRKDVRSQHISDVERSRIFSGLRCGNFIQPGNNPFKQPVHCCNICSLRAKSLSQKPLPSKDLCIVCGGFRPWKNNDTQAFLCQQHKQFTAPDTDKCYLCGRVIFLKQSAAMYEKCYCCTMCSVNKRCIALSRK
ncbi:telomerase protein component 1 isoform X1 [Hydra vulgaris]|uniref:telomerase protein component 1 isoform X1 n=1 Tax=Hydra vulgaris TaxID=6087 RepID=UPI001F5EFD1F|nr:telomerase protein component 1 isoform X1 [Hydra vulgaris]XP_047134859.1 telomerase protein component 1 isoform X1 [Hydra vulgaris]XP_047134860.1 telomerase protein component 1 isoform X1 [Hydra vulgaris]